MAVQCFYIFQRCLFLYCMCPLNLRNEWLSMLAWEWLCTLTETHACMSWTTTWLLSLKKWVWGGGAWFVTSQMIWNIKGISVILKGLGGHYIYFLPKPCQAQIKVYFINASIHTEGIFKKSFEGLPLLNIPILIIDIQYQNQVRVGPWWYQPTMPDSVSACWVNATCSLEA